jgi:kynureninase
MAISIPRCGAFPPRSSVEATRRTLGLWSRGDLNWVTWLDEPDKVRREFATLMGVSPAQVGVGHTTAALVNVVAANLKSDSWVLVPSARAEIDSSGSPTGTSLTPSSLRARRAVCSTEVTGTASVEAALTGLHHTPIMILRSGESRYELYVMRTFALCTWEWLIDAALPFGYEFTESD